MFTIGKGGAMREVLRKRAAALRDESGQTIVLGLFFLMIFIPMGAAVFDVGLLVNDRREAQNAVDRSALAGAQDLTLSSEGDGGWADAVASAQQWLLNNSVPQDIVDIASITPSSLAGCVVGADADLGYPNAITVSFDREARSFLVGALGITDWEVGATATACAFESVLPYTLMAMSPDECPALRLVGNTEAYIDGGGTFTNADCDGALTGVGGSILTSVGQGHDVVGTVSGGGTISPDPNTGVNQLLDPFRLVTPPSVNNGACQNVNLSGAGPHTLAPGCYNSLDVSPSQTVHLSGGEYIFRGDVRIQGTVDSQGDQVLLYMTCSPAPCDGNRTAGDLDITAQATVRAIGHPDYSNILFWTDRTSQPAPEITTRGGACLELRGSLYNITGTVDTAGSSCVDTLEVSIVADKIVLRGGSTISMTWDADWAPPDFYFALIE
jgi:Flp pilus assembly protein TadG